jgi:hypothetical protein
MNGTKIDLILFAQNIFVSFLPKGGVSLSKGKKDSKLSTNVTNKSNKICVVFAGRAKDFSPPASFGQNGNATARRGKVCLPFFPQKERGGQR